MFNLIIATFISQASAVAEFRCYGHCWDVVATNAEGCFDCRDCMFNYSETECFEHFEREDINGAGWEKCADEGGICKCKGKVAMHAEGHGMWHSHGTVFQDNVESSIECSPSAFGSDPAWGVHKECYCKDKLKYECRSSCDGTDPTIRDVIATNFADCESCNRDGSCDNAVLIAADVLFGGGDIAFRGKDRCQRRFAQHCWGPENSIHRKSMEYKEHGTCGQEPICPDQSVSCPVENQNGIPGCYCAAGFVRNTITGACIPPIECPRSPDPVSVPLRELDVASQAQPADATLPEDEVSLVV
jgi:hypothetical protein